jgi:hypothetical protein
MMSVRLKTLDQEPGVSVSSAPLNPAVNRDGAQGLALEDNVQDLESGGLEHATADVARHHIML